MGQRCSHVVKHKAISHHNMVVCHNVEGRGHMPPDFHALTKKSLTNKCPSLNDYDRLNIQENQCWYRSPFLITGRRKLVSGSGFERMGVASWHIQTLPHQIPSTFGWVCPYSHYDMAYMETQPKAHLPSLCNL